MAFTEIEQNTKMLSIYMEHYELMQGFCELSNIKVTPSIFERGNQKYVIMETVDDKFNFLYDFSGGDSDKPESKPYDISSKTKQKITFDGLSIHHATVTIKKVDYYFSIIGELPFKNGTFVLFNSTTKSIWKCTYKDAIKVGLLL